MLTGIGKAECNTHTISGTLSVDSSQNMLFITTYMLQFPQHCQHYQANA